MKKKETYVQAPMVNWYEPRMLLNIGLKAIISGTFGNYADRREIQAALDDNLDPADWQKLEDEYCKDKEDIWIDVVNDTGDGFDATYAIARCVAAKSLMLKSKDGAETGESLPRAKILIFGGDEVYPFPTIEEYTNRFKVPFGAAAEDRTEADKKEGRPHMYAIPGNHDWYDGLGNFIKLFCQKRWIGIWSTKQHRSYFALPLPNRYWIWATDIQLNSDIDQPQLRYFREISETKMKAGDKVILITAEPAWVFHELMKADRSFNKLKFFVETYIRNKDGRLQTREGVSRPGFKLAATLTGDLHHYSRYQKKDDDGGHQYITAGGGGAFLHETHSLPECLKSVGKGDIHLQKTFPERADSRRLMWRNFAFPWMNKLFTILLICIYLVFFAILRNTNYDYLRTMRENADSLGNFFMHTGMMLVKSPGILLLTIALAFGFYAFSDTKIYGRWTGLVGALHGICQTLLIYGAMYFIGVWPLCDGAAPHWLEKAGIIAGICAAGGIVAATMFGAYLFLSNCFFGMHINEASSSFASPDFKNFLRLHVHKDGLTIYPIGIRKVPTGWKTVPPKADPLIPADERYHFEGKEPEAFLIEPPIHIHNDKLS